MEKVILTVPDMSCGHCERTVLDTLQSVEGIRNVNVDLPSHQVWVDFDPAHVSVATMSDLLQAEDYPVASVTPANA
jgi:copper chaperone